MESPPVSVVVITEVIESKIGVADSSVVSATGSSSTGCTVGCWPAESSGTDAGAGSSALDSGEASGASETPEMPSKLSGAICGAALSTDDGESGAKDTGATDTGAAGTDSGGATHAFLDQVAARGFRFSVGFEPVRQAILRSCGVGPTTTATPRLSAASATSTTTSGGG